MTKSVRVLVAALAALVVAGSGLAVSQPAMAAQGAGIDPDSIVITRVPAGDPNAQLQKGDTVRIDADWAVPDGTESGYEFWMELPSVFEVTQIAPFDLVATDGTAGTCYPQKTPPKVTCTLND